jgi:hypothetical protein
MTTRRQALLLLGIGTLAGLAIWVFSPWITGHAEPWDAEAPIWLYSWIAVAVVGGLIGRIRGVCLPLGYALGQMLFTIKFAFFSAFFGEFGWLGWMFIGGYAVAAVGLTLLLVAVASLLRWLRRPRGAGADRV